MINARKTRMLEKEQVSKLNVVNLKILGIQFHEKKYSLLQLN